MLLLLDSKTENKVDLVEACIIGNLSGGITFYNGGVFKERYSGEKRAVMNRC